MSKSNAKNDKVVEYALIAVLVGIAIIAVAPHLGKLIHKVFPSVSEERPVERLVDREEMFDRQQQLTALVEGLIAF